MSLVEIADPDHQDGPPARVTVVAVRPRWFWPVLVAGIYAAGVLVVAMAEYVSEMAKIGRGTYTDSFSPFLFTHLLTLPTSAVHPHQVDYPATFSASISRHLLPEAMLRTLIDVGVQALAIFAIVLACRSWVPRRGADRALGTTTMSPSQVPLNIFGVGFGLAGLATTWRVADSLDLAPGSIATVVALIAAAVWVVSVVLYVRHVTVGAGNLVGDVQNMTVGPFASLVIIVPLLLVVDGLAPYAPDLARVLVDLLIAAVVVAGGLFTGFWMRGGTELERLHPGYFLPTVAGGFVASAAAAEVGQARLAQIMFGLGLICWTIVGSMILGRLVFRPPLPDALVPTMAIEVAPAAVASLALFFASDGQVTTPLALLAGYGLLMVTAQLPLLPRYLSLSFSLGTWAFTFSWAAVASAGLFWIAAESPPGQRVWSYLLLAAITVPVGAITVRTLVAMAHRTLLPHAALVAAPSTGALP